jgi:peptidoglycan hydrolase-like protein with peptidoglycan-binding domain
MTSIKKSLAILASLALLASPALAGAQTALHVSCAGVANSNSITWTASSTGGVAPIALLWSNNSTSSVQTIAETPGTYSISLQGIDASSTVATTTCSSTVQQPSSTTTPPTTGTTTTAQIQALIAQINALKAQILQLIIAQGGNGTTTATSTPPSKHGICFDITRDLKKGDDGEDVKTLQQSLAKDPNIFPEGLVTGHFGPATEKAVMKFQQQFGVGTTTGFFGIKSRGLFRQFCGEIGNGKGNPHNPNSLLKKVSDDQDKNNQGKGKGHENEGNDH